MSQVEKPSSVENKSGVLEKLGIADEIKKGIDEIRSGIRENISSVWDGFKALLSKGIKKLFGIPVESKEQTPTAKTAETTEVKNPEQQDKKNDNENKSNDTDTENKEEELKLEESEKFKKIIEQFQKEIDQPIKTVCYPASGIMSINDAFKDAKITYIDIDEKAISAHQKAGHNAVKTDLSEYKAEENPDLTILLNPAVKDDKLNKFLKNVKENKFVIANNYHGTADQLHKDSSFELLGVLPPDGSNIDKEKLEKYFDQKNRDEQKTKFTAHYFIFKRKKQEPQPVEQAA